MKVWYRVIVQNTNLFYLQKEKCEYCRRDIRGDNLHSCNDIAIILRFFNAYITNNVFTHTYTDTYVNAQFKLY